MDSRTGPRRLVRLPTDSNTRLLGPFDPYVQLKDQETLVPDPTAQKTVWPTLGRPGTVVVGGTITGLWRPRASGKTLKVAITPWGTWSRSARAAMAEQAEILAEFRGVELSNWSKYLDRASGIRIIPAHTRPDSEKETPNDNLNATFARTLVQER